MALLGSGADGRQQIGVVGAGDLFDVHADRSGRRDRDDDDIAAVRDRRFEAGSGQPRSAVRIAAGVAGPVHNDGRRIVAGCPAGDDAQQNRGQGEPITVGADPIPTTALAFGPSSSARWLSGSCRRCAT